MPSGDEIDLARIFIFIDANFMEQKKLESFTEELPIYCCSSFVRKNLGVAWERGYLGSRL